MPTPLLRMRSDEQLVTLFRNGHDEAFRVIHDRYHQRLFAYTRQMLPIQMDAEDALQDVFLRVYTSLRASDRSVARLRPWLYRAAHNRCIDELRRPPLPPPEVMAEIRSPIHDPVVQFDERESLKRVLEDIRRLPPQQRSALLLRELAGAHYADIAVALEISVSAVKSLLVRARMSLASSLGARDTACSTIREELTLAYDRGAHPNATAKRHIRDCAGCRDFRRELRGTSRQLAGLVPALGPLGILAKALGLGGAGSGASAGGGGAAGGGAAVVGGGGALAASAGVLTGGHVATLIAAAMATAGGAVEIQNAVMSSSPPAQSLPAAISSPPPSVQIVAPSAAAPASSAALTQPPPSTASSTSGQPSAANTSASPAQTAIRQPSITGIDTVSKPTTASPIGHTAITGTTDVSAIKPSTTNQSASTGISTSGGSTGTSSGSTSTSSGSTSTSSGSASTSSGSASAPSGSTTSTSDGSQSGAAQSSQMTSSSSSTDPSQTPSPSSSAGGTTGTDAGSN
jgi:RNA polymerase sigma factor (sigma-70 family)